MSHQLCQNCGSNQFEHIDGRLYCMICQSQNIALQIHVSFANEGSGQLGRRVRDQALGTSMLDETIPKIEIFESNETTAHPVNQTDETISRLNDLSVDDNEQLLLEQHIWSTYEVYSYILHIQIQSIIQLEYVSKDKHKEFTECAFMLYLRYLSSNGILETNQQRSLERQEERRMKTNILAKLVYADRYDQLARTNTHVLKKNLCIINLDILIGLIHCASTLIHCPITIKQLIAWINTNKLPYYNIKTYLPGWMRATGRDRFNLEKSNVHPANLLFHYNTFFQPVIKPYISRCLFQSPSHFYDILMHVCELHCQQVYFPFDDHTRTFFQSMCTLIVQTKSTGRRFLSTTFDLEFSALSIIITLVLLRSINDPLLDEFIQQISNKQLFSYSLWLQNLNQLIYLEAIRSYQFYGRTSVLLESITDNHSKLRYMKSLSKIFTRSLQVTNKRTSDEINEQEKQLRKILTDNAKQGSLVYAMKPNEFFAGHFPHVSMSSLPLFFETIVNTSSPSHFSLVDKSELYETLLSLFNGATIIQIEHFYLLHQRFDIATSSNFLLNHLIATLTKFCSIPYNQDFYSFLSLFLKTFCFQEQSLHHYFYRSTSSKRFNVRNLSDQIGMKRYGNDQLPIIYDIKSEQERARTNEKNNE